MAKHRTGAVRAPKPVVAPTVCPNAVDDMSGRKRINLALQGGGAHGAFAWGVLDRFLEDGRVDVEAVSGTSAGSMNAVVLAYGKMMGGHAGARELLNRFWKQISEAGERYSPIKRFPWESAMKGWNMENSPSFAMFESMTRWFSPYQLNPGDFNPLREVLTKLVDFDALKTCTRTKLFIAATNVRTGKVRVFRTEEVNADVVMASACLPFLYKAVRINGEHYWDGGYMGNPALFPFFYHTESPDIVVVHINPIERPGPPMQPTEIFNRVNEISFNSSLLKEFRAISFVHKLLDDGWIKDEYRDKLKYCHVHSVRADVALSDLSVATKFATEWDFLQMLKHRGRAAAGEWLLHHYDDLGERSTVDLRREFLGSGSAHVG
jgi:NTE family protein